MHARQFSFRIAGSVCLLLAASALNAAAIDSSAFVVFLQNTGADADARGSVTASLCSGAASLVVRAEKLTPGNTYAMTVGGRPKAWVKADALGKAQLLFANPPAQGKQNLNFDPRGRVLALEDGTNMVLQAVISGSGEPPNSYALERSSLGRVNPAARSKTATAQYSLSRSDRKFRLTLNNVSGTNWWVYVDGVPRTRVPVRDGIGIVVFHNTPTNRSERLLDFDPRGRVVDIAQGTNLMFSGSLEARVQNVNVATPWVRPGIIPSTGAWSGGVAKARVRTHRDAVSEFSVELEHVPAGDYELLANGIARGTITVPAGTNSGEVEFSTGSDDLDKLPLLFAPLTSNFTIRQGSTVFFHGAIGTRYPAAAADHSPVRIEEGLMSSGLDRNAHGRAEFEIDAEGKSKFSVEIEHVAPGTYSLYVGGALKGTFAARAAVNESVDGEIEFSSSNDDPHELPLDFDPRGSLVQVTSSAGLLFSHMFGLGDAPAETAAPLEIELPLFSAGLSGRGTAEANYDRNDHGCRSFEVELEDVPEGDYSLLVGGQYQGTITVQPSEDGTRGKISFEDSPESGETLLEFEPLGQLLSIERDGAVWFQRALPNPSS